MARKKLKKGDYRQFVNMAHYPSLHRKWGYITAVYSDGYGFKFVDGLEMYVSASELN